MDNNLFMSDSEDDEDYTDSDSISLNNVPQQPIAATKKWDAFQVKKRKDS